MPTLQYVSGSARPSGSGADVPGIGISSTLGIELETVVFAHRPANVWDYIDEVRAVQTRLVPAAVTHYQSSEHGRLSQTGHATR